MKTVKKAVSIPEDIFYLAEDTAKKLGISRSRLYANAIAALLEKHKQALVTEKLNTVYAHEPSGLDPALSAMQFSSLLHEDWA